MKCARKQQHRSHFTWLLTAWGCRRQVPGFSCCCRALAWRHHFVSNALEWNSGTAQSPWLLGFHLLCHCCHVESRDGSRLKSVRAFTPFRHHSSVTVAQTESTRSALTDIACPQKVLGALLSAHLYTLLPHLLLGAFQTRALLPSCGGWPLWPALCVALPPSCSLCGQQRLVETLWVPTFCCPSCTALLPDPSSLSPGPLCPLPWAHSSPGSQVPQGQWQGQHPPDPQGAVWRCLAPHRQGEGSTWGDECLHFAEEMAASAILRRGVPVAAHSCQCLLRGWAPQ